MEIVEKAEAWTSHDDPVFSHTCLVVKKNDDYYHAAVPGRMDSVINCEELDLELIPRHTLWPAFHETFTTASNAQDPDSYIKLPAMIGFPRPADLIIHELRICEILAQSPHPHIARYFGCLREGDYVKGLCFKRYRKSLQDCIYSKDDLLDPDAVCRGIELGIRHLHGLGLVHNDINPSNIMFDEHNQPVIIDFDSCGYEGDKTGIKESTFGWECETSTGFLRRENDYHALGLIREALKR